MTGMNIRFRSHPGGSPTKRPPISVVMPVYNGMDTLDQSLPALLRQRGAVLGVDYEIIVVDDGSTDGSADHVQTHYPRARLIRHRENRGRIEARLTGVKAARFERILLIDVRVIAAGDLLQTYWALGAPSPCMTRGGANQEHITPLERVFHCLRAAYYRPYILSNDQPRLVITKENFLRAPKGTTAIFLERKDYLDALPKRRDRSVNDDTRLFAAMIEKGPIYRDARLKITYLQRPSLRQEVPHLYERGIRFADFYLQPGGAYRMHALVASFLGCAWLAMLLVFPLTAVAAMLILLAAASILLARKPADAVYLFTLLPLLGASFVAGAIVGMLRHQRAAAATGRFPRSH